MARFRLTIIEPLISNLNRFIFRDKSVRDHGHNLNKKMPENDVTGELTYFINAVCTITRRQPPTDSKLLKSIFSFPGIFSFLGQTI